MAFIEILKELVRRVDGADGATLMGMDGIAVATHQASSASFIEQFGTEFGMIVSGVKKAADTFGLGAVNEVAVDAGKYRVIVSMVGEDYFIALLVAKGASAGKARYHLAKAARAALAEL